MRVLRAIGLVLGLVPMLSFAGWRQVGTITPVVTDVQMVDAGVVLAVSDIGGAIVWRVTDAGVTTINTLAGNFTGGGYYPPNCLLGMSGAGLLTPTAGCGTPTQISPSGAWLGFKLLSSPPYAVAFRYSPPISFHVGPGATGAWTQATSGIGGSSATSSLQTREINGVDYTALNSGIGLRVSVDGGSANPVVNTSSWRDAAPFPLDGQPAILGVTTASALVLIPDYRTPAPLTPSIPAVSPTNVAMSGVTGMVTTATGVLLSPIPNPARVAETWVTRPGPSGQTLVGKIHCIDDRYCVTANAAGAVWMWKNEVPPSVSVVVPPLAPSQTVRFFADAGDGDGDPIYVSWDGGAGGIWSSVAGVDDGTQIDFTVPSGACAPFSVDVTVTDGLAGHERTVQVPMIIDDRGALQVSAASMRPIAGGGPVSFSASTDGGCSIPTVSWSTSDGRTGTGANFSWTPPPTECNADGGLVTITGTATWPGGMRSASQQVSVKPWGAPDQPVFASPAAQRSGTSVDYLPTDVGHVCNGASDFPGTRLIWEFDAGLPFSVIGGALRVAPPSSCTAQQVTATALRAVIGEDEGRVSLPATLVVDITPDFSPIGDFAISVQGDAGVLFGVYELDAGCADQRNLSVIVTASTSGVRVAEDDFQDGGWRLEIPGGCAGGTYDVVAELFEDGGLVPGARDQGSITLPFSPVVIGAQSIDRLEVVCGAGARGTVSLIPAPNACASAEVNWRATGGPALVTMSGTGATFELETEATDFSGVGQQLTVEWSADAGAGNGDSASHSIELTVQPFLEFSVKARPPLRREEEAVALDVTLRNTTDCFVEDLSVTLPLSGGSPLLESVLLDGVRTAARQTDEGLVIDGVSVPPSGFTVIQLSARAQLLSSPRVQPVASLRGYVVSTVTPAAERDTGCGCAQVDVTALLGVLVLFFRRRRS